jgi:hypothetical protein
MDPDDLQQLLPDTLGTLPLDHLSFDDFCELATAAGLDVSQMSETDFQELVASLPQGDPDALLAAFGSGALAPDAMSFDALTDLMAKAGINPSQLTDDQVDQLMASSLPPDADASVLPVETPPQKVSFGSAGSCYTCSGTGVVSSFGKNEVCWRCGGTGIAAT